jgi:hypothetical protein
MRMRKAIFAFLAAVLSCSSYAAPDLDKEKLESVVFWVNFMLRENKPGMAAKLVGSIGVKVAPYATSARSRGKNNAAEAVAIFKDALRGTTPECIGYDPKFGTQPDKAIIYVKGLSGEHFPQEAPLGANDIVGIQFFKIKGRWELVWLTPLSPAFMPPIEQLLPCH